MTIRHLIPWRLIGWIDDHTEWCWASLATWNMGLGTEWDEITRHTCREESVREKCCWCGKFQGGVKAR